MYHSYVDKEKLKNNIEGKFPQYVRTEHGDIWNDDIYDMGAGVECNRVVVSADRKKQPYRIESYLHSDSFTQNKAGALVKVTAQTDFAVKTDVFIAFCKKVAQMACGFQTNSLSVLFSNTNLEEELKELKKALKEEVEIVFIGFLN